MLEIIIFMAIRYFTKRIAIFFFELDTKITPQLRKLLLRQIVLILLLLWNITTYAQSVAYQNLTTKDGLPSNTVYQIKQDKKGFIWMATANGLVRYDGTKFKVFNSKGIKDKEILGIFIDADYKIWFWNLKGQLFYIINNEAKELRFANKNIKIRDFNQSKDGTFFFIAGGLGLYRLNKNNRCKKISTNIYAQNIIQSNDGLLLKMRDYIFDILDDKINVRFTFYWPIMGSGLKHKMSFKEMNAQYWCLQQWTDELYKVDINGKFRGFGFPAYRKLLEGGVNMIANDNDNRYWVILRDKILVFDAAEEHLIARISFPLGSKATHFLHDKEGNYWLGLNDNGVIFIPSIDFKSQIKFQDNDENDFTIQGLYLTDNELIISKSQGNIIIKNLNNDKERYFNCNHNLPIQFIKKGFDDDIWLISNIKATILNSNLNIIENDVGIQIVNYKSIYFDNLLQTVFIGNYDGVLKIKKENYNTFIKDKGKTLSWHSIRHKHKIQGVDKRVYAIEKVKNEYWFGSTDGLYYSNGDTAILSNLKELTDSWITNIINQNDTVWVGTQTDGLFQIINKKITKVYNETNGLVSNQCKKLLVEPNGIVWVGTNNGINKININTGEIDLINNLDGLLSNDINALAINDKYIFVGTSEGLTTFRKDIQTKNKVAPPIYLSKFQIYDKDTVLLKSYTLEYDQNNIRIHFTGVSFRSQGTFKYKYRMRGISDKWTETQSNIASFPILNPDKYTFEAYAINEDGVKSEVPIRIEIIVKAPFWQTWWFWFLMVGTGLFITWRIAQKRINRIEKQLKLENDFQQKINVLKMQALQTQMNPHFIFNALNSIQHYLTIGKGEQAMIYLAKFAKLIRMIFEYSKKFSIVLTDEIAFLKLYLELEKVRFKNKIEVNFSVNLDIYTDDFKVPSLLIQPIIENSFKHGLLHKESGSKIQIIFMNENGWLKCIIEDNGIGREKAKKIWKYKTKKHNSSGLKITEERLNMWVNQQRTVEEKIDCFKIIDLKDENGNAAGTRVEMILGKIEVE
jgi:ligand-binding sensor domain-containing protein